VEFENLGTTVEVVMSGSLDAGHSSWNLAQYVFAEPETHVEANCASPGSIFTHPANTAWISVILMQKCTWSLKLLVCRYCPLSRTVRLTFDTVDGTNNTTVLGFFIEVSEDKASTLLLENIFAHLNEIREPGSSTEVPTVDFSDFQTMANAAKY
jgi:hypothetical protein